jgi:hypothetical protein
MCPADVFCVVAPCSAFALRAVQNFLSGSTRCVGQHCFELSACQVREDSRKKTELDDLIRAAQQKVAAARKKLDDVERMSATSELTLTLALRGDLERATASMANVRVCACVCARVRVCVRACDATPSQTIQPTALLQSFLI